MYRFFYKWIDGKVGVKIWTIRKRLLRHSENRKRKIYEVLIQYDYFIQGAVRVLIMDYRKEIEIMINRIQSEKILRYIYLFIADIPKRYWR